MLGIARASGSQRLGYHVEGRWFLFLGSIVSSGVVNLSGSCAMGD